MPVSNGILHGFGQSVQNAVFNPSRTNDVDRDLPGSECNSKIAAEDFHGRFRRTHCHPRLPAAKGAARRIRNRDDAGRRLASIEMLRARRLKMLSLGN